MIVSCLGTTLLILWFIRVGYVTLIQGRTSSFPFGFNPDKRCKDIGTSCGALSGLVVPWLLLAAATAVFLIHRLRVIVGRYQKTARVKPYELVPTVGSIMERPDDALRIVGRDDLCYVIADSLHSREDRQPHVLIGGVGTGKTAVLIQLTKLLSACGAVPVPVRLRDAQDDLDFHGLAYKRFYNQVSQRLPSKEQGDKIWRHLRKDQRIVVVADGLEEALSESNKDRDNLIRIAIRRAKDDRLPLVIASRPHNPLRGMEATLLELEPLSEEAALEYLGQGSKTEDSQRLDRIVETADIAETPLYLRITRELDQAQLLQHSATGQYGEEVLDTRGLDRSALRLSLLQTWTTGLIQGRLGPQLPLTRDEREAMVAFVSALACVGLKNDQLEVKYEDLIETDGSGQDKFRNKSLGERVEQSLEKLGSRRIDIRLATTWATQLKLVEARGDHVWFPHSILQAYLGSRLLDAALKERAFADEALGGPNRPGREFLIALVLLSRRNNCDASRADLRSQTLPSQHGLRISLRQVGSTHRIGTGKSSFLVDLLRDAAGKRDDSKALDIYAAALEIDSADQGPEHLNIARAVVDRWESFCASDQRTFEEAKLGLVHRFGEAIREIERQYRERGAGRRARLLRARVGQAESAGQRPTARVRVNGLAHGVTDPAYLMLYEIGYRESTSYAVRHAVAQEIGAGGGAAFKALKSKMDEALEAARSGWNSAESADADKRGEGWRKSIMCAWLAPLLSGSVSENQHYTEADENLRRWVERVGHEGSNPTRLPISVEMALAQGFKYAANRRRRHPYARDEARAYLVEQATDLLKRTDFWFSQLTLLHALCLWALPDDPGAGRRTDGFEKRGPEYDPEPETRVKHWLTIAGCHRMEGRSTEEGPAVAKQRHPFVNETAWLAMRALQTEQPERFIWIDESGVVSRVGSRAKDRDGQRKHNLWIPSSIGWSALDDLAQQLVADVLLLINLAERGEHAEWRLERTNRKDLPPCLSRNRQPLDPDRAVSVAVISEPGTTCPAGCPFDLCPYPPKGTQSYRAELSEVFCRRQQALVSRSKFRRRSSPWQGTLLDNLKQFWVDMGKRARH